jgi:hypothetical protein
MANEDAIAESVVAAAFTLDKIVLQRRNAGGIKWNDARFAKLGFSDNQVRRLGAEGQVLYLQSQCFSSTQICTAQETNNGLKS